MPQALTYPLVTIGGDVREVHNSGEQRFPLGHLIMVGAQGYRYAKAGGSITAGTMVMTANNQGNHQSQNMSVAAVVGDTSVTAVISAAASENDYAEGQFFVSGGTGKGFSYPILGHPAGASTVVLKLGAPLKTALATGGTTKVSLIRNPYNGVQVAGASPAVPCCGVAMQTVTSGQFFWVQTIGIANVLGVTTAVVAGDPVQPGASGAVTVWTTASIEPIVGHAWQTSIVSGDQAIIRLMLE